MFSSSRRRDLSPVFSLATLLVTSFTLFLNFVVLGFLVARQRGSNLALVQLTDGRAVLASVFPSSVRSDEVLRSFARDIYTGLFTWTWRFENNQVDSGVEIRSGLIVPTSVWSSSFALSPGFRVPFVAEVASSFGVRERGSVSFYPVITNVSRPRSVSEGVWEVDIIATIAVVGSSRPIPANYTFVLRAVDPPRYIDLNYSPDVLASFRAIEAVRASGLEVVDIRPML